MDGYAAVGRALYPVNSLDDAAALFDTAAVVPAHFPSSAHFLPHDWLGARFKDSGTLQTLDERVSAATTAKDMIERLYLSNCVVLVTKRKQCAVILLPRITLHRHDGEREMSAIVCTMT